jgi:hypothetical protein
LQKEIQKIARSDQSSEIVASTCKMNLAKGATPQVMKNAGKLVIRETSSHAPLIDRAFLLKNFFGKI